MSEVGTPPPHNLEKPHRLVASINKSIHIIYLNSSSFSQNVTSINFLVDFYSGMVMVFRNNSLTIIYSMFVGRTKAEYHR